MQDPWASTKSEEVPTAIIWFGPTFEGQTAFNVKHITEDMLNFAVWVVCSFPYPKLSDSY